MKKRGLDLTPVCKKCGKEPPINHEMSTNEWVVYMTKEPCKCGGEWISKFMLEKEKANDEA